MEPINEVEIVLRSLTEGARMVSPRSTVRDTLEAALRAVHVARVAAGEWAPDTEQVCPAMLADEVGCDETGIGGYAMALVTDEQLAVTDEQLATATVERSAVDDTYLRMRCAGQEWLIEIDHDGSPDGHTGYHARAHGEVTRG